MDAVKNLLANNCRENHKSPAIFPDVTVASDSGQRLVGKNTLRHGYGCCLAIFGGSHGKELDKTTGESGD